MSDAKKTVEQFIILPYNTSMSSCKQLTIKEIYSQGKLAVTYEVFPPKTEQDKLNLMEELKKLKKFSPQFISVTYGAGGSTQQRSTDLLNVIIESCEVSVVPHFTCIGSNKESILQFLQILKNLNIKNILALRGDPPQNNPAYNPALDSFKHANELVEFLRSNSDLNIAVAGYPDKHPEAKTLEEDIDNLKRKVDAGASAVITQLFYANDNFFKFTEKTKKAGINVPVIPGILPLTNYNQVERIISLCGAVISKEMKEQLELNKNDKETVRKIGIEHAVYQIKELIKFGIKGVHMYTLNKAEVSTKVLENIL